MPESIAETLTADHRRCDRLLALVEAATGAGGWDPVVREAREFERAMERHFRFEEEALFPALEAAAPMASGLDRGDAPGASPDAADAGGSSGRDPGP